MGGYRLLSEGRARIRVPDVEYPARGPGRRMPGFYNPAMRTARDMDVCLLRALGGGPMRMLDSLAGTGVRGIRVMLEVPGMEGCVEFNDASARACSLIAQNLAENNLSARVHHGGFLMAVSRGGFDWVDVDPYGTPVPFIHPALSVIRRGYISVTATDTAVLSMRRASICRRRYGVHGTRTYMHPEIGLRALLGWLIRTSASLDRGVRVLLGFWGGHYHRCHLLVERGVSSAEGSLSRLGEMRVDSRSITPLYLGPLFDEDALSRMEPFEWMGPGCRRLLSVFKEECGLPPGYYHVDLLAKGMGIDPPSPTRLVETLRSHGFGASRTHFEPKGVKTDAASEDIVRLLQEGRE